MDLVGAFRLLPDKSLAGGGGAEKDSVSEPKQTTYARRRFGFADQARLRPRGDLIKMIRHGRENLRSLVRLCYYLGTLRNRATRQAGKTEQLQKFRRPKLADLRFYVRVIITWGHALTSA